MPRVHFEILTERAELHRIRATWFEWARDRAVSPFAAPAFFEAWCEAFSASRTGFVVAGFRGRELQLVLPLWHPNGESNHWNTLGAFRADYTEAVSRIPDPALGIAFWRWLEIDASCTAAKIALAPTDSLLGSTAPATRRRDRALRAIRTLAASGKVRDVTTVTHAEHPYADRSQILELADRIDAKYMRRNVKALAKQGGDVSYALLRGARTISPLLPAFFDMHVANFAGTGRVSQFESELDRTFYRALVTHPELENIITMDVLSAANRPVALHLGFQQRDQIYYYKPSFDLELAKVSPGKILLAYLFARAKQQSVDRIDLLKGTESYKAEWSNRSRITLTATLVQRSIGALVRSARDHWRSH